MNRTHVTMGIIVLFFTACNNSTPSKEAVKKYPDLAAAHKED